MDVSTPADVCMVICPTFDTCPAPLVTTCKAPPDGKSGTVMTLSPAGELAEVGSNYAVIFVVLSFAAFSKDKPMLGANMMSDATVPCT